MRRVTGVTWGWRLAAVLLRNVRTPGQRLVGIQKVDARTGGPVSLRSAIARQLIDIGYQRVERLAFGRSLRERSAETHRHLQEIRAASFEHPHADENELERAARRDAVSCAPSLAKAIALSLVMPLSARLSPRGQTLGDRLSGVIVVHARPSPLEVRRARRHR